LLNDQHLILIRAALQYFDEELSPHGVEAMAAYLTTPSLDPAIVEQLSDLRTWLPHSRVAYACVQPASNRLAGDRLYDSPEEAEHAVEGTPSIVVPVLLPE
jgi:hypothetical protein